MCFSLWFFHFCILPYLYRSFLLPLYLSFATYAALLLHAFTFHTTFLMRSLTTSFVCSLVAYYVLFLVVFSLSMRLSLRLFISLPLFFSMSLSTFLFLISLIVMFSSFSYFSHLLLSSNHTLSPILPSYHPLTFFAHFNVTHSCNALHPNSALWQARKGDRVAHTSGDVAKPYPSWMVTCTCELALTIDKFDTNLANSTRLNSVVEAIRKRLLQYPRLAKQINICIKQSKLKSATKIPWCAVVAKMKQDLCACATCYTSHLWNSIVLWDQSTQTTCAHSEEIKIAQPWPQNQRCSKNVQIEIRSRDLACACSKCSFLYIRLLLEIFVLPPYFFSHNRNKHHIH